jgi:hypothetical protein
MGTPQGRRRVGPVKVGNVVLVVVLALASWVGTELVLDMLRAREPRPVPPIVLEVRDDRPERRAKGSERGTDRGSSPTSGGQPDSGAEPALPPPPPPAGDDDDDDDDDDDGGDDTDDGDD